MTREEFVKKYSPFVVSITKGTGIFPQTLLAQAIIESQGKTADGSYQPGQDNLAKKYNNYFGIKADSSWHGPKVNLDTGEVFNGKSVVIKDAFRVYSSFEDSAKDYVAFLKNNPRYQKAGVFTAKTFQEQGERLKAAGYATGEGYWQLIANVGNNIKSWITDNPAKTGIGVILLLLGGFFLIKSLKR